MKAMKVAFVLAVSAWPATLPAQSTSGAQGTSQHVYVPGIGAGFPTLLRQEQPVYSDAARRAKIEGIVVLEAVVQANGTVDQVRVVRSLDTVHGLDENAVAAAKRWLFRPAFREGKPVATIVTLELQYRLSDGGLASPLSLPPTPVTDDEFLKGAFDADTPGLVSPKLLAWRQPLYTADAMRAKIQGVVEVEAVVGIDGTIIRSRVKRSLDKDFGLDLQAIGAANKYLFEPGRLNGQVVSVVVTISMEFRLH